MTNLSIDGERLLKRLRELGELGRGADGKLTRLAASAADKLGRDRFVDWAKAAGLDVKVDRIGNILALWNDAEDPAAPPLMLGSHIDTVIDAGIYDGCYGVLSGLEVVETLKQAGFKPRQPIVVAAFTNEEGVRFAPDMMGSLVYAGGVATRGRTGRHGHGRQCARRRTGAHRLCRSRGAGFPQAASLCRATYRAGAGARA